VCPGGKYRIESPSALVHWTYAPWITHAKSYRRGSEVGPSGSPFTPERLWNTIAVSMLTYSPGPGESRTTVIVWETDDETKVGDPRYWWTEADAERVRRLALDLPDPVGRPKGFSLASLRQQAENDQVEWIFGDTRMRFSLSLWEEADPDRTYLIVGHQHKPTAEEQMIIDQEGSRFPPEVEEVRQKLRAAVEAHNDEQAQELRDQLA